MANPAHPPPDAVGYAPDHPAVLASLEAMAHGRRSWEALRDECYAWLRMRENLDPGATSNVGERNITWYMHRNGPRYGVALHGPWGHRGFTMHAPATLEEARSGVLLERAVAKRDKTRAELVAEFGDMRSRPARGLFEQIRAVLDATEQGRERLKRGDGVFVAICELASTAAAYAPEEWNPNNARDIHQIFHRFPDRVQLVQRDWKREDAREEIARRRAMEREKPSRKGRAFSAPTIVSAPRPSHQSNGGMSPVPLRLRREIRRALSFGCTVEQIHELVDELAGKQGAQAA